MADSTGLEVAANTDSALTDTQVDEYYVDITSERFALDIKNLLRNPYPGLRPFKTSESIVFFGREGVSNQLIERLAQSRFLAVLGTSGTGKSSLVRAGLLTTIETLPGGQGSWKTVICRPGKNPFGNLAKAIHAANIIPGMDEINIWKILSGSSYGYEELIKGINHAKLNILIIVDQFEEIFRYRTDNGISGKNDAALFVKMLIKTTENKSLNTFVLITMRSEYIGDCVQMPLLVDKINSNQYLVPRLKYEEIAHTITEPVKFSNALTSEGYQDLVIGEIGDGIDQLPVLQHLLMRSYEAALKRTRPSEKIIVNYNDYVEAGRMAGALDKHAGDIYKKFDLKQQEYCRILFQCLIDRSTDGRGIRRPLSYKKILAICLEKSGGTAMQVRSDLDVVIESFRKENTNFLMPAPHVPLSDDLEIDISHESLMRIWTLPQKWIDEESKDALLLRELIGLNKNEALSESKLLVFQDLLKRIGKGTTWAFLHKPADESVEKFEADFKASKDFIKSSAREIKRRHMWRVVGGAVALLFFAALGGILLRTLEQGAQIDLLNAKNDTISLQKARSDRDLIEKNVQNIKLQLQQDSLSKQKDSLSKQNITMHLQQDSLSNQNAKLQTQQDSLSKQKELLLMQNRDLQAYNLEINQKSESLNKSNASLAEESKKSNNLRNLALAIRHSEKSLSIPVNDPKRADIKAHLALVAFQFYANSGRLDSNKLQAQVFSALYDALKDKSGIDTKAARVTTYQSGSDHLSSGAIFAGTASSVLFMTSEDQTLYGYDLQDRKTILAKKFATGNRFVNIEASAKGLLAINTLSKKLLLVNTEEGMEESILYLPSIARAAKFSEDGSTLYTYCMDSTLAIFTVADESQRSQKLNIKLEDIAISNTHVYGLTARGQVVRWQLGTNTFGNQENIDMDNVNLSARATVISCTPDGRSVAWGNDKGQVFLKKEGEARAQYLTRFSGPVSNILFSNASGLLAISSFDKTIQVFNRDNLQSEVPLILADNTGPVSSLFFQKNKERKEELVAVVSPGLVKTYPMDMPTLACMLNKIAKNKTVTQQDIDMYMDKEARDTKIDIRCQ